MAESWEGEAMEPDGSGLSPSPSASGREAQPGDDECLRLLAAGFSGVVLRLSAAGVLLAYETCEPPASLPLDWGSALGKELERWLPEHAAARCRLQLSQALTSGGCSSWEFAWVCSDAAHAWQARIVPRGREVLMLLCEVSAERQRLRQLEREVQRQASALEQKDTLLREVHHRVKNHLQVISSLLNIQLARAGDSQARGVLEEASNRVRSISMLHESLSQDPLPELVDMRDYLAKVVRNLTRTYAEVARRVSVEEQLAEVMLPVDLTLPCGLILNELVTNALKHAFPAQRTGAGRLQIALLSGGSGEVSAGARDLAGQGVELWVKDDGVGLPNENAWGASTVGMSLVRALGRQLGAKLQTRSGSHGTAIGVIFDGAQTQSRHSQPAFSG